MSFPKSSSIFHPSDIVQAVRQAGLFGCNSARRIHTTNDAWDKP